MNSSKITISFDLISLINPFSANLTVVFLAFLIAS